MSSKEQTRERWDSRSAFLLAAIGSAVGLGNIIRFPAVCYANGGGAFLIPYIVALFTAGIPLLILEFGIGQMMQASAPKSLKKVNKHTEWVGWFALLVASVISIYYSAIMAWSLEFLGASLKALFTGSNLAWATGESKGGAGAFFEGKVLNIYKTKEELWTYYWPVILGLVLTWSTVYVIICKGVLRVGKVVKWSVTLPILVLAIMIAKGLTLPGAGTGISYYLSPNLEKLGDPKTWLAAYGQIFFSLTIGFGVMIAYASYRPKESDVTNNAFITALGNCATSFIAGFAVFSVVGFMEQQGQTVKSGGLGLAFVTYPTAISQLGGAWGAIFAILFFFMLFTLGIDSLFSLVEAVVSALRDRYPGLTQARVALVFCLVGLTLSIIFFSNRAGIMWVDCLDHWANDYGLAIVGLLQCLIVGYFFNTDKLRDYINNVSEIKLWGWWELCVKVITPVILVFLLASTLINDLERGQIYGMSANNSNPFDAYAWLAPVIFLSLFVIAFALTEMRSYLYLIAGGLLVFVISRKLLGDNTKAAICCALGFSILIGGLVKCLLIAHKGKTGEVKQQVDE